MSSANHKPMETLLDHATQALRNTVIPAGPQDELVRQTLARLEAEEHTGHANRLRERRRVVFRMVRYGGLAAAAAIVVALCSLWLMDQSATPAFADVVAKVQKAKSVTFRMTQKLTPESPALHEKWYLQGESMRLELLDQKGHVLEAFVIDYRNKKGMRLNFVQKTARSIPGDRQMPANFNPIASLRRAKDTDARFIGNEDLDGQKTRVYVFTQLHALGLSGKVKPGETAKLWVDRASGLPVRMVIETSLAKGKGKSSLIFHDFQWNQPLRAELFKLQPPPGFKVAIAQPKSRGVEQ